MYTVITKKAENEILQQLVLQEVPFPQWIDGSMTKLNGSVRDGGTYKGFGSGWRVCFDEKLERKGNGTVQSWR